MEDISVHYVTRLVKYEFFVFTVMEQCFMDDVELVQCRLLFCMN